jgi:hypothetical protein
MSSKFSSVLQINDLDDFIGPGQVLSTTVKRLDSLFLKELKPELKGMHKTH